MVSSSRGIEERNRETDARISPTKHEENQQRQPSTTNHHRSGSSTAGRRHGVYGQGTAT